MFKPVELAFSGTWILNSPNDTVDSRIIKFMDEYSRSVMNDNFPFFPMRNRIAAGISYIPEIGIRTRTLGRKQVGREERTEVSKGVKGSIYARPVISFVRPINITGHPPLKHTLCQHGR